MMRFNQHCQAVFQQQQLCELLLQGKLIHSALHFGQADRQVLL